MTSHKTGVNKFDASKLDAELLEKYAAAVKGKAAADPTTAEDIQDEINDVNADKAIIQAVEVVNNESSTPVQVRSALTTIAIKEGNDAYLNLSNTGKLEVADLVIEARPAGGYVAVGASPGPAQSEAEVIDGQITAQITVRGDLIDDVNGINGTDAVPVAFDYTTVDDELKKLDNDNYNLLTGLARINAAQNFYNNMPTKTKADGSVVEAEYTTLTDINTDIDKAVAAPAPINN